MVEMRSVGVERVAAEKLQPRRVALHRKRQREGLLARVLLEHGGGEDQQFLGGRPERGEHARAVDDYSVAGLLDQAQGEVGVGLPGPSGGAAGARIEQRVGGAPIVVARRAIVLHDIVAEALVGGGEELVRGRHRRDAGVEVVGRAPEHPAAELGPSPHHRAALAHVVGALRLDEGEAGALAALDAIGHRLGMLDLHVVERGERARDRLERRMGGRVGDALAADPDFALELAHRAQIIVARARAHQRISCNCGSRLRSRSAASSGAM